MTKTTIKPPETPTQDWPSALADYQAKRAYEKGLPGDAPNGDKAVVAWCDALDRLVDIPAPDVAAVAAKLELARDRWDGFELPDSVTDAILADLRRLAQRPEGDDTELLAAFAEYQRAWRAFERDGDPDDPDCPLMTAYHASVSAMDAAPPALTVTGAIAWLRFGIADGNTDAEEQTIFLDGSAANRAAYVRGCWGEGDAERRPMMGALGALEAINAA